MGLLALLLYQDSRRGARVDADGGIVDARQARPRALGPHRNRRGRCAAARRRAHRRAGPYQLQAAIASVHAQAASADEIDWPAIVTLYDRLCELAPSPIAALNRAVAVAYADGPRAGYEALAALPAAELDDYHLYHVARGDALRRLGDSAAARSAYERALERAGNARERAFLRERLADLAEG